MKTLLRFLVRLLWRLRAYNTHILKAPGPVLLIPNHQSLLDFLFLGVLLPDDWKFVASDVAARQNWLHRRVIRNKRTFLIDSTSPYAVKRMAEHLENGGRLVLFAEGRLSRTGSLMKLFDGTGFLLHRTQAKVITCHLDGIERLRWTAHPNLKWWFPRVTAHFSDLLTPPKVGHVSTAQARATLTGWLRDRMIDQQFDVAMKHGQSNALSAVIQTARRRPKQVVMEDATRQALTYRKLLIGVDLMSRQWRQLLGETSSERIGVLLPNVNATPVVLLSLWAAGKVPAVLNFSTGMATMLACIEIAGLKIIITSKAFLDRFKLDIDPFIKAGLGILYLEDVRARMSSGQKLLALVRHTRSTGSGIKTSHCRGDASALVLFTSGSEGVPKGVELTHANLIANIRQMLAITDITDSDRLFSALPMFHSFGVTIGTLLPLVRGIYVFIYPSPLHYRVVPTAFYDRDCTIMVGTNTFLNGYARKAHPYDFRSLRYMFAGAEKVQEATANLWSRKFGVRILEGYGATECSPCVSLNTPMNAKYGSAGKLLPHIEYRLEPVEGVTEGGRLLVRGPNVMRGYLNKDADREFKALGGWYDTGDIVNVDADGFVFILGRLKRFAKVSGEMVSLTAVEDALAGAFPQYGLRCQVAVLSRPDEDKGEALIAVTNEPRLQLDEIRSAIKAKGLTNLCVPREIKAVKEIPKLGTGKVDHRELARIISTSERH
ncbi:MAG TPA: AMP-binding protein [Verrucomicrobiae bacterium]|nr:AMP-binding protein [Verrucomicrobiae bacterium]